MGKLRKLKDHYLMVYNLCFLAGTEIPGKNFEEGPYSSTSCPKTTGKDYRVKNKYFLKQITFSKSAICNTPLFPIEFPSLAPPRLGSMVQWEKK